MNAEHSTLMPHLKGALHAHTTLSDGTLSPGRVVEIHRELGYDFLAITDHDFLVKPDYWERIPESAEGFLVFAGIELTVFARGYQHVNRIKGHGEELYFFNHPAECDLPLANVKEIIEQVAKKMPIAGVEITSKGFYTPEFDTDEIPFPKIASDDSHTEVGIGRAWIELDANLEKDTILRAVKAGDFENVFYRRNHAQRQEQSQGGFKR